MLVTKFKELGNHGIFLSLMEELFKPQLLKLGRVKKKILLKPRKF